MTEQEEPNKLKRELGLLDGTMLVVGSMIGSGIFIVSSDMLRQVGSSGYLLLAWLFSGIMTVIAAVSYGELSAMFPKAGGQYVYLKEAYNKLIAFLYGWSFFTVIQTGTIAAVGVAFAKFTAYIFPWFSENNIIFKTTFFNISAAQILSILSIILLTYINSLGVSNGKKIQTFLTIIKIISFIGLIVFGFILAFDTDVWLNNWINPFQGSVYNTENQNWSAITSTLLFSGIIGAMVGSLFSSDAWNGVTFISGEIKNPERNVGLSLFLGTSIVCILYILANVMYLGVLPLNEIATAPSDRVAVEASNVIFGSIGTIIIAILIMISTFGCNNGLIMAGARVYYTMAKDKLFFSKAKRLNKNSVPGWGLWLQCLWASILCLTGKYGDLLDFVVIIVLVFYILTIYGIFILRKKQPDYPRSYKAFGYPYLPMVYIILASIICITLLITKTSTCGWGVLIMISGIPVYYLSKKSDTTNQI